MARRAREKAGGVPCMERRLTLGSCNNLRVRLTSRAPSCRIEGTEPTEVPAIETDGSPECRGATSIWKLEQPPFTKVGGPLEPRDVSDTDGSNLPTEAWRRRGLGGSSYSQAALAATWPKPGSNLSCRDGKFLEIINGIIRRYRITRHTRHSAQPDLSWALGSAPS